MATMPTLATGSFGQRFVDDNFEIREEIRQANGGVMPSIPNFTTSYCSGQSDWNETNLPDILFYVIPPPSAYAGMPIQDLIENGQPVVGFDGKNIKHFDILPRRISLTCPGWLMETWRRLDPRIVYRDILQRMDITPVAGFRPFVRPTTNSLQNHCFRSCRDILGSWVDRPTKHEPYRAEVEALESLTSLNFCLNTILPVSKDFPGRLVRKRFIKDSVDGQLRAVLAHVTILNLHQTTFPINHFENLDRSKAARVKENVDKVSSVLFMLQARAKLHRVRHWSSLERKCMPSSWFSRVRKNFQTNSTYDGGCVICTHSYGSLLEDTTDDDEEVLGPGRAGYPVGYHGSPRGWCRYRLRKPKKRTGKQYTRDGKKVRRGRRTLEEEDEEVWWEKVKVKMQVTFLESDEEEGDEGAYETEVEMEEVEAQELRIAAWLGAL